MQLTRGYTLVETLIAVFTLTLLVLAVTGVAVATTRLLTESKRHTVALGIVNGRVEKIRALPFHDVGLATLGEGIFTTETEDVAYGNNPHAYVLETKVDTVDDSLDGTGGADGDGNVVDYKRVQVRATWTSSSGAPREVVVVTYVVPARKSLSCSTCPGGFACDTSIGFCLPTRVVDQLVPTQEGEIGYCVPGTECSGGSLCPLSASCADAEASPPAESGKACTPGLSCQNGALCPLSGVCPSETCLDGTCEDSDVCFSNFCYDPDWYQVSFPASDWSGPGSEMSLQCKDSEHGGERNSCTTTNDCPETCLTDDGTQVIWQCEEQTWVPDCRLGNVGGALSACRGGYDEAGNCQSGFECEPEACPGGGYCSVNGKECGPSSSNAACSADGDCPGGEVCGAGQCRTICPSSEDCRIFWGGFTRGCRAYAITGAVPDPTLPACPDVAGLSPAPTPVYSYPTPVYGYPTPSYPTPSTPVPAPAPQAQVLIIGGRVVCGGGNCTYYPHVVEGDSGLAQLPFFVRLTEAFTVPVSVRVTTDLYPPTPPNPHVASSNDFVDYDQVFTFPPGVVTLPGWVNVTGDTASEGGPVANFPKAEYFGFRLTDFDPSLVTQGNFGAIGVIEDDD